MGASGWWYFTPYRDDPKEALRELQDRVFAARDYGNPLFKGTFIRWIFRAMRAQPASIEEAVVQGAENGTHSILDIDRIGKSPASRCAWPLSDRDVEKIVGSRTPSHDDVDRHRGELSMSVKRWQATYLVVFEDDKPTEYYFEGASGD
jgi:hypothetical protein